LFFCNVSRLEADLPVAAGVLALLDVFEPLGEDDKGEVDNGDELEDDEFSDAVEGRLISLLFSSRKSLIIEFNRSAIV
jgi:hypothetical protein